MFRGVADEDNVNGLIPVWLITFSWFSSTNYFISGWKVCFIKIDTYIAVLDKDFNTKVVGFLSA